MKTLSALFLVLVTTVSGSAQTVNLGQLQWTPGVNNAVSYFTTSNPGAITHTLTLGPATGSKQSVLLGFNKDGGGYAWSARLLGFPDVTNAQATGSAGVRAWHVGFNPGSAASRSLQSNSIGTVL